MLELANRRTNLLNFCHPALVELARHDEKHNGELMDTLFYYLQFAGSTTRAAKLLCLHKNTMLYRMGRIRELLGMDLTSGEVIFILQVSFRALMYLGLYVPKLKTTRAQLGTQ
jgi:DNA-binding PucR family transcriptional regulator